MFERRDTRDQLVDLLERERKAITTGNFEMLGRLAPEKDRLLRAVGAAGNTGDLVHLRERADRNQELLQAAARGLLSVRERLKQLRTIRQDVKTYDSTGRRGAALAVKSSFTRHV